MTNEEYLLCQQQIMLCGQILSQHDIGAFLARINTAESIGPISDPTLWIKGNERLAAVKDIADVAQTFAGRYKKHKFAFLPTEDKLRGVLADHKL